MTEMGPDDFACRLCHAPVRYATVVGTHRKATFDAVEVPRGGYRLGEQMTDVDGQQVATGEWLAQYVRSADRGDEMGFRAHDCPAKREQWPRLEADA